MELNLFTLFYMLVGGLGFFLFGMKTLSEGLQSMASGAIRRAISIIARNRVFAVLTGTVVTVLVQSSSISTVMMSGLVNAGLMNLSQAIGFIFGANIGTTITGWIISVKVGKYGLLLVGLGFFPMTFAKKDKWESIGKLFFALGLIFVGLEFMGDAFKPLRYNQHFISVLSVFDASVWYYRLIIFLIGCVTTMIIQSSSAMLGITIALASQGVINFETSAALVLGQNIGTTITLWLASIGAGQMARRTALAHTAFNVIGVLIAFFIFGWYIRFVDYLVLGDPSAVFADGTYGLAAVHIAAVHTIFNLSMTVLFLPFLPLLEKFVCTVFPDKTRSKQAPKLSYLSNPANMAPEVALLESQLVLSKMTKQASKMMDITAHFFGNDELDLDDLGRITKLEGVTDRMQFEITSFLSEVMREPLSGAQINRVQRVIRVADEIESVGDYCQSISRFYQRLRDDHTGVPEHLVGHLETYWKHVHAFYEDAAKCICDEDLARTMNMEKVRIRYKALNEEADMLRDKYLDTLEITHNDPMMLVTCSDIVVAVRRIKNHTLNIYEALAGGKKRDHE